LISLKYNNKIELKSTEPRGGKRKPIVKEEEENKDEQKKLGGK
jgi:hypothetical protein